MAETMKATKTGGDVVQENEITVSEIQAYQDTNKLFGIAAGHVVFNKSILELVEDQEQQLERVGVVGRQKVGKSTLMNALYDVEALTGDSSDTHTTNGIQLFVKKGRAVFDSEGAASEDKRNDLSTQVETVGQASRQHFALVKSYRLNLEAALMVIVVAMCNPVIYVFSDPNGCSELLEVILMAAGKFKTGDRGNRRLILVYNKYIGDASDPMTVPCFKNMMREEGLQDFFPGGIECVLIPDLHKSPDTYDGAVSNLRAIIDRMQTNSLRLDTILKTMEKITDNINTATGTLYLDRMITATYKEICEATIEAQKAMFRTICQSGDFLSREEFTQLHDKAKRALEVIDGVPKAMIDTYASTLSTFLDMEFYQKLKKCTALCSCPNRRECTLGNVAHEGADKKMHQCDTMLQCTRGCGVLRCEEEQKCHHCPQTCPKHHLYCTRHRQQHGDFYCEFDCTVPMECSVCDFVFPKKVKCSNGNPFVCPCCAGAGHKWQGHEHQKVNCPPPTSDFLGIGGAIANAHWMCAGEGCTFHKGMYRWDTITDNEKSGGSCTSVCANPGCGLFNVKGRITGVVTRTHNGWPTTAACCS